MKIFKLQLSLLCVLASLFLYPANAAGLKRTYALDQLDTIYAGHVLSNTTLIANTTNKYSLLIRANNTYVSIKLLQRDVKIRDNKISVTQKLYNGTFTNTDSVILNRQTLMPVESYSDINTSKDSFIYTNNKVTGTVLEKEGTRKGMLTKTDTAFLRPMFNGLIYMETYQALSYQKNQPFYLAEYVPGHNTKFTRIEYIKDDEVLISGVKIPAKLLEMKTGPVTVYCWLNAKNQEILKVEAKFPRFDYYLERLL